MPNRNDYFLRWESHPPGYDYSLWQDALVPNNIDDVADDGNELFSDSD